MKESTTISFKTTAIATLIATAVGIWSMQLGIGKLLWPAHPQLMVFVLTIIACIVAKSASVNWLKRNAKS